MPSCSGVTCGTNGRRDLHAGVHAVGAALGPPPWALSQTLGTRRGPRPAPQMQAAGESGHNQRGEGVGDGGQSWGGRGCRSLRRCGGLESTSAWELSRGVWGSYLKSPHIIPSQELARRSSVGAACQDVLGAQSLALLPELGETCLGPRQPQCLHLHNGAAGSTHLPGTLHGLGGWRRPADLKKYTVSEASFLYPRFSCKKPPRAGAQLGVTMGGELLATGHGRARGCTDRAPG